MSIYPNASLMLFPDHLDFSQRLIPLFSLFVIPTGRNGASCGLWKIVTTINEEIRH